MARFLCHLGWHSWVRFIDATKDTEPADICLHCDTVRGI